MEFILASASPRRSELLQKIIKEFKIIPSTCEEVVDKMLSPKEIVESLSLQKAEDVFLKNPQSVVIGCDTIVSCNNLILGKPHSVKQAEDMLKMLSDRTHSVFTGVTIMAGEKKEIFSVETKVVFKPLSAREIEKYIETLEPMDKAGAYGIQGFGSVFVREIKGDYFTVMGLPINALYEKLSEMNLI